ncbi:MAG: DUF5666 domain-containing protein [Vicinamibacterales bacterium]
MSLRLRSWFLVCCSAAVLAVGCGEGSPLNSPTSPSGTQSFAPLAADENATVATTASLDGGAATLLKAGNGNGNGGNKGKGGGDDSVESENQHQNHDQHCRSGMLSGFVTEVGDGFIVIRGFEVTIDEATIIRHGNRRDLTIDDIEEGDHAQARVTCDDSTTPPTLLATEVKVEDTGHDNEDNDPVGDSEEQESEEEEAEEDQAKAEGLVSALSATACPDKTFNIGTTAVTTNASTKYKGGACADLNDGDEVEVKGTPQAGGGILATRIEF